MPMRRCRSLTFLMALLAVFWALHVAHPHVVHAQDDDGGSEDGGSSDGGSPAAAPDPDAAPAAPEAAPPPPAPDAPAAPEAAPTNPESAGANTNTPDEAPPPPSPEGDNVNSPESGNANSPDAGNVNAPEGNTNVSPESGNLNSDSRESLNPESSNGNGATPTPTPTASGNANTDPLAKPLTPEQAQRHLDASACPQVGQCITPLNQSQNVLPASGNLEARNSSCLPTSVTQQQQLMGIEPKMSAGDLYEHINGVNANGGTLPDTAVSKLNNGLLPDGYTAEVVSSRADTLANLQNGPQSVWLHDNSTSAVQMMGYQGSYTDPNWSHEVTALSYDPGSDTVKIADPADGKVKWISGSDFNRTFVNAINIRGPSR